MHSIFMNSEALHKEAGDHLVNFSYLVTFLFYFQRAPNFGQSELFTGDTYKYNHSAGPLIREASP